MLVSSAEPAVFKQLGKSSSVPERYGADFLFTAHKKFVGIQRKEINDLIASRHDGRLALEVQQLSRLSMSLLIVEGKLRWTDDGLLLSKGSGYGQQFTKAQYQGTIWSAQLAGVWYTTTEDSTQTMETIVRFVNWCRKDKHRSLERRPGATSAWGSPDSADYARHLVMGIPTVGTETADRIIAKFGGVPFRWKGSIEDLMAIEGIGRKKAEKIWTAIEPLR